MPQPQAQVETAPLAFRWIKSELMRKRFLPDCTHCAQVFRKNQFLLFSDRPIFSRRFLHKRRTDELILQHWINLTVPPGSMPGSCLSPRIEGSILSQAWKDA